MQPLRNALWGVGQAAWAVAACVAIAALAAWIDQSLAPADLLALVRFYLTAGLFAGLTLGLGRPLLKSTIGRGVVGFLVALPVFYLALFAPPSGSGLPVDSVSLAGWLMLAAFLGPVGAAYVTIRNRQRGGDASRPDA
jgi:hypothetical protein